ncbi:S-phase kinase-associated protein [Blastocystis sp. ATCC 50177/Nand II]|uniref:S-phase kinase-associated protein n=1 Tax=Blastocystis sp. subtype 1 (strain ATCC 50177 / NandII) TaxID=478820 RepID=A0A196SF82_BLAHN|nr:S-phase kinase-associated protein [Blastocystis sp. ATCC 50177/Nand II]
MKGQRHQNPNSQKQHRNTFTMSKVVKVLSKEGKEVDFSEEAAKTSKYLQTVLKEDPTCTSISTTIPCASLEIARDFLEYHVNKPMASIPKPLTDNQNFRNNIEDDFDSDLVMRLNRDEIFDLLYAAQTLQNESLVSLSAAYTASLINGKNVTELREFFQVEDDLTEEEKLQIDKENACFRI